MSQPSKEEGLNRRSALRLGLLALGGAVAAAAAERSKFAAAEEPAEVTPTPVLTADGKLVHVDISKARPIGRPASDPAVRTGIPGRKWVMVIDLAKCDGCKACTVACNKMHNTPSDREWIKVFKMQDDPKAAPYWFPKPCFHCDTPPCTKVCPVDATFKREDGLVLIDSDRCIGCRFCMAACPYSTRFFNWGKPEAAGATAEPTTMPEHQYSPEMGHPRKMGTVEKCDFCPEYAERGELPPCATSCSMGAIYFGDENEDAVSNVAGETARLSTLLEERAGYRYMEELGTKPRVHYLPPRGRMYPAPKDPPAHG